VRIEQSVKIAGAVALAALVVVAAAACRGGKAPATSGAPLSGEITTDGVKTVLGAANDYASGVVDVTQGQGEVIVAYRYYDVDLQNYETDFAAELAPRVQALYKRFPSLDRVHFQVTANNPVTAGLWEPFTEFVLDRKTVEEIHWTGFLSRYLLDLVLKNKKT
jgi:hypothetical protein